MNKIIRSFNYKCQELTKNIKMKKQTKKNTNVNNNGTKM